MGGQAVSFGKGCGAEALEGSSGAGPDFPNNSKPQLDDKAVRDCQAPTRVLDNCFRIANISQRRLDPRRRTGKAPPSVESGDGFVRTTVPAPNVDQDEGRLPRVMIDVKPLAMARTGPKNSTSVWEKMEGPRGEDHVRATAFTAAAEVPNKATAAEQADLGGPIPLRGV